MGGGVGARAVLVRCAEDRFGVIGVAARLEAVGVVLETAFWGAAVAWAMLVASPQMVNTAIMTYEYLPGLKLAQQVFSHWTIKKSSRSSCVSKLCKMRLSP